MLIVFLIKNPDIITNSVGRIKTDNAIGLQHLFVDDPVEHFVGIVKEYFGFFTFYRIIKNGRVFPVDAPGMEKEGPVDIIADFCQVVVFEVFIAEECGFINGAAVPINFYVIFPGFIQ